MLYRRAKTEMQGHNPLPMSKLRLIAKRLASAFDIAADDDERSYPPLRAGETLYCIGDIHGRRDCLANVHAAIDADRSARSDRDVLEIYLGDYIDRGMQSRQVIDDLLERRERVPCLMLKGNHEAALLAVISGTLDLEAWRAVGGMETLLSYGLDPRIVLNAGVEAPALLADRLPAVHLDLLRSLPLSHVHGAYFFVHAGIRPKIPLDRQAEEDLLFIREPFLSAGSDHGVIVVHGHTPATEVEFRANRINLDVGAYATGRLACLRIDDTGVRLLTP